MIQSIEKYKVNDLISTAGLKFYLVISVHKQIKMTVIKDIDTGGKFKIDFGKTSFAHIPTFSMFCFHCAKDTKHFKRNNNNTCC